MQPMITLPVKPEIRLAYIIRSYGKDPAHAGLVRSLKRNQDFLIRLMYRDPHATIQSVLEYNEWVEYAFASMSNA